MEKRNSIDKTPLRPYFCRVQHRSTLNYSAMRIRNTLFRLGLLAIIVAAISSCAMRDCNGNKKTKHPGGFYMQVDPVSEQNREV